MAAAKLVAILPKGPCMLRRWGPHQLHFLLRKASSSSTDSIRVVQPISRDPSRVAAQAAAQPEELQDEHDDFFELPDPLHIRVHDGFTPLAPQLRHHFDSRVGQPLKTRGERFCWDYWHVPGQYSLLRTPAEHFFPPELYDALEDALIRYGEHELGCRGISPIWLSYYIHGCRQELHADNPHGPWAFVLSLTNWEGRPFTGGETTILQPRVLDYWRTFDSSLGTETPQLVTTIEPQFNRLTLFDPRFPHGVRLVEGTMDPLQSRVVLHGWFTSPTPFFEGSLSEEEATPTLNATLEKLYADLEELPLVTGALVVRLEVSGADGEVVDLRWLTHTLVSRPQGDLDPDDTVAEVVACVAQGLLGSRFPVSSDGRGTQITVPFMFE